MKLVTFSHRSEDDTLDIKPPQQNSGKRDRHKKKHKEERRERGPPCRESDRSLCSFKIVFPLYVFLPVDFFHFLRMNYCLSLMCFQVSTAAQKKKKNDETEESEKGKKCGKKKTDVD